MKLELPNVIVDKIQTLKDRSLKVTLITRELSSSQKVDLFDALLQESNLEIAVIPEEGGKSPASRMRSVLHVLWEQEYKPSYEDFELFYRVQMEKIIQMIKDKLN